MRFKSRLQTEHYRVELRLGRGSMAVVYMAVDERSGERVALKVMHQVHARNPTARKRFRREAKAAQRLTTPHAVRVFELGELADGSPFMVMELLEGETLGHLIRETGPLPQEFSLFLADQIASALQDAHANGIVHRDLQPENVFVVGQGESAWVKVVDFGISKFVGELENSKLTGTGVLIGTPLYMAPEQFRGSKELDHRVDIYALGLLIYEMLAGVSPFSGAANLVDLLRLATKPAPLLSYYCPELPLGLVDAVARAMAYAPEDRFLSIESMRAQLAPYWHGPGFGQDVSERRDTEPTSEPYMEEQNPNESSPDWSGLLASLGPPPAKVPRPSKIPSAFASVPELAALPRFELPIDPEAASLAPSKQKR